MRTTTTRFLLVIALVGCGGGSSGTGGDDGPPDGPPVVVDGPPMPDVPTVCSAADPNSCSGETICIGTTCEPAFGRIYLFSQISAAAAPLKPGGGAWDLGGGAPDLKVDVTLNGTIIRTTAEKGDTFAAIFDESAEQQIVAGSKLQLTEIDVDLGADETIFSCTIDPLSAEVLRQRVIICDGSGNTAGSEIVIHIDAKG